MSIAALRNADGDSVFLFPWAPNRLMYRSVLEDIWHKDPAPQMLGVSTVAEAQAICTTLREKPHVVAFGHVSGKQLTDVVYQQCGTQWPRRTRQEFFLTYTEHWQAR